MPGHRPRWRLSRAMLAVAAVAAMLAALRVLLMAFPHARRCWEVAAGEGRLGRSYRREAARYRACALAVPCSPSEYCDNACLPHVAAPGAGRPAASEQDRRAAAEAHRRAAEDHEHAADLHAEMAHRCRWAAFRWSQAPPTWTAGAEEAADAFRRYPCDRF